jgi:hypothetical protein
MNKIYSTYIKIISQSRFEVPIDTHLIESLTNVRSLMMCGALCDRHNICRTADYDSTQKLCRLFETSPSAGTFLYDPTTSILTLNYCTNDQQTEPEYVCTRSGTFTVQQIFDNLTSATNMTLSLTDRGIYANMYGVYTSSYTGYISFFTYTGVQTILTNLSSEVTNINSVPFNGLSIVQYYNNFSIIYKNIGDPSEPELVPILNITLSDTPYSCVTTLNYLYIAYVSNQIIMTIHNLSTGLILYTVSSNYSPTYRPVVTQWNDTIIIIDQCQITEYSLNGVYQRSWSYLNGFQSSVRNYIHHDYSGRLYICNYGGTNPGIYVFLLNGTEIAHGYGSCYRAFQLYLTKEQAMFINISTSGATMQIIDF